MAIAGNKLAGALVMVMALCLAALHPCAYAAEAISGHNDPLAAQVYHYTSAPSRTAHDRNREAVSMSFRPVGDKVVCSSRTVSAQTVVNVSLSVRPNGDIIAAERTELSKKTDEILSRQVIWQTNRTIQIQDRMSDNTKKKSTPLLDGQKYAADISLLYLMRSFPFESNAVWRVRMADFSGRFVSVSVHNRSEERVTVPGGTFDCYRMEVVIRVAILKASINYWLAKDPPHYLVKHLGKKGPFSRSHLTVLEAIEEQEEEKVAPQTYEDFAD